MLTRAVPPPLPVIAPPPPPPPPTPPRMFASGGLTVYMTDYKSILQQNGYPDLNFGAAFGWSAKAAIPEFSVSVHMPQYADAEFTWISPLVRSGVGVPTVPISIGGYTFGPRLADTISLKASLSGERFMLATPYFTNRRVMPTGMCEWWHLNTIASGIPNTSTTSQATIEVKQDFNKIMLGVGVSGESVQTPMCVSYRALYTSGGHTSGCLLEAGLGYRQNNMWAEIGYRYSTRKLPFDTGNVEVSTNGPYARLNLVF